jgi:hypothetical protein
MTFLDLRTMNQPEFYFAFPKELKDGHLPDSALGFLRSYIEKFAEWIKERVE